MAAKKAPARAKRTGPPRAASNGKDRLYTSQVRELVDLMVRNELTSLEIVNGDLKVSLGRGSPAGAGASVAPAAVAAPSPAHAHAAPAAAALPPAAPEAPAEALAEIRSPMVGTFYSAPSPDSEPYVVAGARVTPDTVVCIIEAMKVMNEIKAECSGTVAQVVVKNGQPVEYGQVLFRVRAD